MSKRPPKLSLIIVQYNAKDVLFSCLTSIFASRPKTSFEVFVVDNDEVGEIQKDLLKKFPQVKYIKSPTNMGFGGGVNHGTTWARGEFLCFLNPDTIVLGSAIDLLYKFASQTKQAGIVSGIMHSEDRKTSIPQGAGRLSPLKAIFTFSFIHKFFPTNPIAKQFWRDQWRGEEVKRAASVPLGIAIIKRSIFESIGGFDEKFFLYYEDYDLNKRVEEAGYDNYLYGKAEVIHLGGKGGTGSVKNLSTIYRKSRFYYFRKHYGLLAAILVSVVLNFSKKTAVFCSILLLAGFLLTYRLGDLMMFIGDFGWFYLSARDMILTGNIPLVGIASSHPWLHQGPLWTYLLALGLQISNFNPLSGGVIAALFGFGSVILIYLLAKEMFSERVGLLAALLMATSPLVIIHARMPYHTAPIPFFTLLFLLGVYRLIRGGKYGLPLAIFSLSVLYNLELATVTYAFAFLPIILFGFVKKPSWSIQLQSRKALGFSLLAGIMPMAPVLIYDMQHGFPQTLGFAAWIGYKVLTIFGFPSLHPGQESTSVIAVVTFFMEYMKRLVFLPNGILAMVLFLGSSIFFGVTLYKEIRRNKGSREKMSNLLLGWFFIVGIVGFFAAKTTSEAYLPMLFPTIILVESYFFAALLQSKPAKIITALVLFGIVAGNLTSLLQQQYLIGVPGGYGPSFSERVQAADGIVKAAGENSYTIKGTGPGSQYESFTMNYDYLTWWLSHGPSESGSVTFSVSETPKKVTVRKEIK